MKEFDKVIARQLREDIDSALISLGKKYDITFHTGSCSYSQVEMTYKLKVTVNDKKALQAKEAEEWNNHYELFGFKKDDLGKKFVMSSTEYMITGFNLKRSKFNLRGKRLNDGKTFLFVASDIAKKPLMK